MRARAAGVVKTVEDLHRRLDALDDLRPGPDVDPVFAALVDVALTTPSRLAHHVLADPVVRRLRPLLVELSARGEYALELAWAERVAADADELARFPYLGNYRLLARVEHDVVVAHLPGPLQRVLFVGSGPLPLSSLLLADRLGVRVDNLDRDARAVDAACRVAVALGAVDRLTFAVGDLIAHDDLAAYDLVVLAALVGVDPDAKRACLAHLARTMAPGALVLARSAHALRTLLYPAVELPTDDPRLHPVAVVHPPAPVINSIVLARVSAGR